MYKLTLKINIRSNIYRFIKIRDLSMIEWITWIMYFNKSSI